MCYLHVVSYEIDHLLFIAMFPSPILLEIFILNYFVFFPRQIYLCATLILLNNLMHFKIYASIYSLRKLFSI